MTTHLSMYNDLSMNTDLYQITMAQGYWADDREDDEACFHLFFRSNPFDGGYAIAAGINVFAEYVQEHFGFDRSDIQFLSELEGNDGKPIFEEEFLEYLSDLEFECDVSAVLEGTPVFPHEPLVRVKGPIIQAQLVETPLLNFVNYQTLVATKANRIVRAGDGPVLEFGLRRAQGPDGGLSAARGAYIGGADGTSNVLAGKKLGIPVKGTHAHSWVQSYDTEEEAFESFARSNPNNGVFLVDTYDTIEGVKKAVKVAEELRQDGHEIVGIRLDSGDLAWLSQRAREILDDAGFEDAKIVASNSLDEYTIQSLDRQDDEIDVYGVGTNLVTCQDDPSLGGVYKLAAIREDEWDFRMKLSERKVKRSIPGVLNVRRFQHEGEYKGDMIFHEPGGKPETTEIINPMDAAQSKTCEGRSHTLLSPFFDNGEPVRSFNANLDAIQERRRHRMSFLHEGIKRYQNPHVYPVGVSEELHEERQNLIEEKS